jgi:hypothetical protein
VTVSSSWPRRTLHERMPGDDHADAGVLLEPPPGRSRALRRP